MLVRVLLFLTLFFGIIDSREYPLAFSQLSIPLYKSSQAFMKLADVESLHDAVLAYNRNTQKVLANGFEVEKNLKNQDMKSYLSQLRRLQKEYDKLLHLLHKSIDSAIKENNYRLFLKLTSYAFDGLLVNSNARNRAIDFYYKNRSKELSPFLEKQIGDSKLMRETLELFKAEIITSSYDSNTQNNTNKKVKIVALRENNIIKVFFENDNIYPVTIQIQEKLKNLIPLKDAKDEIVVAAKSKYNYRVLEVGGAKSYYSYNFRWIMGSKNAIHDDMYIYRLPYKKGTSHYVSQGYNAKKTHKGSSAYAIDFPMPVGTKVYAARAGVVIKTKSNSNKGGYEKKYASSGNYVRILHSDGTMATYYHLKYRGVLVDVGQEVVKGSPLGYSGNTGYSSGPHLHFSVFQAVSGLKNQTIPVKIDSKEGLIQRPKVGSIYTAQ